MFLPNYLQQFSQIVTNCVPAQFLEHRKYAFGLAEPNCSAALLLEAKSLQALILIHCCPACDKRTFSMDRTFRCTNVVSTQNLLCSVLFCFSSGKAQSHAYVASGIGIFIKIRRDMLLAISQGSTTEVECLPGCSGCSGNCTRIRHPCLPALFSNYTTLRSLHFYCCALCPAIASPPPLPAFSLLLCTLDHGLCLLLDDSTSIRTSLERIRNGLGLTLFSAKCLCGFLTS